MPAILQIVEVLGPAEQGLSRPMKCRAEDGRLYYVKGRQTNPHSLWAEWLCAHLGRAFGLQIPDFALLQAGEELLAELPREQRHIGADPAFASCHQDGALWFELSQVDRVPPVLQRELLAFDWWIRNLDRQRGNPNLLWQASAQGLVVIDHNQAFDGAFWPETFLSHHVFAGRWAALAGDWIQQQELADRMRMALPAAEAARDTAPQEWRWSNAEHDVPATFDVQAALDQLARCTQPDFWRTT